MTYLEIENTKSPIRLKAKCEQAYLEYFNDFLSVDCFAEYLGCSRVQALEVIEIGRHWNHLPKIEAVEA